MATLQNMSLVLDGEDHAMQPLERAVDFEDGVEYLHEVDGLAWGPITTILGLGQYGCHFHTSIESHC